MSVARSVDSGMVISATVVSIAFSVLHLVGPSAWLIILRKSRPVVSRITIVTNSGVVSWDK